MTIQQNGIEGTRPPNGVEKGWKAVQHQGGMLKIQG